MNAYEAAAAAREANREYQRRYWEKKGQEYMQSLAEGRAAGEDRRI